MKMETQSCQFGKLSRVQTLSNSSKRGAAGKFLTCNPAIIFKCTYVMIVLQAAHTKLHRIPNLELEHSALIT
jgi:hypothetical protein